MSDETIDRLMRAARHAEMQAAVEATLKFRGQHFTGGKKQDMRVRATVVAVMRELADEFRQVGDKLNDQWAANDPYRSGLVQGAYDADGRLFKWAKEIEDAGT